MTNILIIKPASMHQRHANAKSELMLPLRPSILNSAVAVTALATVDSTILTA
jgi:hypothetical protein